MEGKSETSRLKIVFLLCNTGHSLSRPMKAISIFHFFIIFFLTHRSLSRQIHQHSRPCCRTPGGTQYSGRSDTQSL